MAQMYSGTTTNPLPAILIGGAPNAGKSVLTYNLTQALRRRGVPHYVFRANPDGEGDWFLEANQSIVRQVHIQGHWSDAFVQLVCRDLARRPLPLLVDLGGLPTERDTCIFRACTHSLLLLKAQDAEITQHWLHFLTTNGLLPLAELHSQLDGESALITAEPVVTGTITGLRRDAYLSDLSHLSDPVFDALVERVSQLFGSYSQEELEQLHQQSAPAEPLIHLVDQLHVIAPGAHEWTTDTLRTLLTDLPTQTALSVYERGPNWVYGALALHAPAHPFYQFDARLGWVTPPHVQFQTNISADTFTQSIVSIKENTTDGTYMLTVHPRHSYLDYLEAEQLVFPVAPPHYGIIISGKLPLWLFTALARLYLQQDVSWIALHYVRTHQAIVIYSQVTAHSVGDVVALPV